MSKKINFSIRITGTEDVAKIIYSDEMRHIDKYAILFELLKDCFKNPVEGVPDKVKNEMLEKMINDARAGGGLCEFTLASKC